MLLELWWINSNWPPPVQPTGRTKTLRHVYGYGRQGVLSPVQVRIHGTKALIRGLPKNLLSCEEGSEQGMSGSEDGGTYMSKGSKAGRVESKHFWNMQGGACAGRSICITHLRYHLNTLGGCFFLKYLTSKVLCSGKSEPLILGFEFSWHFWYCWTLPSHCAQPVYREHDGKKDHSWSQGSYISTLVSSMCIA